MEENINLTSNYWNNRYLNNQTGWDIGYSNNALTEFVETTCTSVAEILIPGAGSGYEVEFLWKKGFKNVFALDASEVAKSLFLKRVNDFPQDQYIVGDFFNHESSYDAILEQTFFCALLPTLRHKYVEKMHSLLKDKGILAGVLFNFKKEDGPPFGGSREEYESLFRSRFELKTLELCRNSIVPRQGSEFFIQFVKK